MLFPGPRKKWEMEETELAEHLCAVCGALPALPHLFVGGSPGQPVWLWLLVPMPCSQGSTSLGAAAGICSWLVQCLFHCMGWHIHAWSVPEFQPKTNFIRWN